MRVGLATADRSAGAHALPAPKSVEPVDIRRRKRRRKRGGASWDVGDVAEAAFEILNSL